MSELDPLSGSSAEPVGYEGDPHSWSHIIATANRIIEAAGTVRDSGLADADWSSDFMCKRFLLQRKPRGRGGFDYWLYFSEQYPDESQRQLAPPFFSFHDNYLFVSGVLGAGRYNVESADMRLEYVEIELNSFLQTHPVALDQ